MAGYSIRSLDGLSKAARGYFTGAIQGAIASVWANTFVVIGKVMALLSFEHEQRREWLFRQIFASSADDAWLERHAFELGLTRAPATAAIGSVVFAATPGTLVPAGLALVRGDGATYVTLAPELATGNSVTVEVEADLAGALGNLDAGETLAVDPTAPVDGLAATGDVLAAADGSGLSGGADQEALETFRARVLRRKRQPPQGGSAADYAAWVGEAMPTATAVYVDSFQNDARAVWVAFTVSDQPDGIPSAGQVATVQAYLDDPVRRPVTARVTAVAPVTLPIPVQIQGLYPDTPDVRATVEAELAAVFLDRAEPGRPSAPFVLSQSWLHEAISRATGEDRHRLGAPVNDVSVPAGYLPVLGPVTYTD